MYIPPHFRQPDREKAIAFMKAFPFGMIVSNGTETPLATHLPFHVAANDDEIVLTAHFAKGNPQWKDLRHALVIFSGPHAYVSPALYEKQENVPTWNYIAVHAAGEVSLVTDEKEGFDILEAMMQQSEPEYLKQWTQLSPDYKMRLFRGIMPFRMTVTRLEAKEKLSQNKTAAERQAIISALEKSGDGAAQDISKFMAARDDSSTNFEPTT